MDCFQAMMLGGGGGDRYIPPAVVFDGSNDYLARGADLSSNADSKTFLMSGWFYFTDISTADRRIFQNTGSALHIRVDFTNGKLLINAENAAGTQILVATVDTPVIATGAWTHIAIAIDLANSSNRAAPNPASTPARLPSARMQPSSSSMCRYCQEREQPSSS